MTYDPRRSDADRRTKLMIIIDEFRGEVPGETMAKLAAEIVELRWRMFSIKQTVDGKVAATLGYGPYNNAKAYRDRDIADGWFDVLAEQAHEKS